MARRVLLALSLSLLPGCQAASASADLTPVKASAADEEVERHVILEKVQSAIAAKNYAALSAMEDDFRSSRARTSSGIWKLAVFHAGVQHHLRNAPWQEGCQNLSARFLQNWATATPRNPAPVITNAALSLDQAWCLRGDRYAHLVAPDVWPRFHALVADASQTLKNHHAMASVDPEYYAIKARALLGEGASKATTYEMLEEATSREPYYHRTYFNAAWSFLPQWGGSFAEVERLALYAARKTSTGEDKGFYARVFWNLDTLVPDIMERAADPSVLKQAMRDVYNRYPTRWNSKHNAEVSCRLGDGQAGRQYLRALHPEVTNDRDFAALFAGCDSLAQAPD
jgi:hypothetical protein